MLLRRMIEHVRTQNWLAVFLDFVIVVVGVFIGIQLGNWNEARLTRQEEEVYLVRLHDDMEASLAALAREKELLVEYRRDAQVILKALVENDPSKLDGRGGFDLHAATRINYGKPQLATLNELISGGQMNLLSSARLREAVALLEAELSDLRDLTTLVGGRGDEVATIIHLRLQPYWDEDGTMRTRYSFEELVDDKELHAAVSYSLNLQLTNMYWIDRMITAVRKVDMILEEELGIEPEVSVP